ncbi:hypothetical protein CL628_00075 [bacterium]|nr:hypothetical protein [bacterium]
MHRRHHDLTVQEFTRAQAAKVKTPLTGAFNQENVLAASLVARAAGLSEENIAAGVASVTQIPGRVEWLEHPSGFKVVVDFALTADALERLYQALKPHVAGRLIAVFGAAGRRDRAKRPILTKLAARYADELILTQDEPYEDPEDEIYAELEAGLTDATIPWQRIEDRREAILYALKEAKPGDVIALTGMGNYNTRMVGSKAVDWNDREVVEELFKEIT